MAKLPELPKLLEAQRCDRRAAEAALSAADASLAGAALEAAAEPALEPYDWRYLKHLALSKGVVGIPASPFFSSQHYQRDNNLPPLGRFAFCKRDDTMLTAASRLMSEKSHTTSQQI